MATLNFKFLANDKGLRDGIARSKNQLNGLEKVGKKVGSGLKTALSLAGIGLGLTAAVRGATDFAMKANEDILSQRMLARQLKVTLGATENQIASQERWIQKVSLSTGLLDDTLRPAYAAALRVTGNASKAQDLLNVSMDTAAGTGKDLGIVVKSVGRAYLGNLGGLQKLVPGIKKGDNAMTYLKKNFKDARLTLASPFDRAMVAVDSLQEQIGTSLLPVFQGFADWFTNNSPEISQFFSDLVDPNSKTGGAIKKLADNFEKLSIQVDNFFKQFDENKKSGLVGFLNLVADAVGAIADEAEYLAGYWKFFTTGDVSGVLNSDLFQGVVNRGQNAGQNLSITQPQNNYTININKSTMSAQDIVRAIQRYERNSGSQYLLPTGPTN
jgi:hypothetical protein